MELKKLTVHNYKSLVNFELNEPSAFTVFAGPNGAGKSNIFEAIEFGSYKFLYRSYTEVEKMFGGRNVFRNFKVNTPTYEFALNFGIYQSAFGFLGPDTGSPMYFSQAFEDYDTDEYKRMDQGQQLVPMQRQFLKNFLRLFIKNEKVRRVNSLNGDRLLPDASNLSSVLKRILADETIKEEFLEWLNLFIPGFSNIEIHSDNIGGTNTLLIYEKGIERPFTQNLISDGTYNILALLTAVYQTNEPQFLCIEEPENGLNPYVVRKLVDFFRQQCEEKGHVIWLNTHSQTLVSQLRPEEIVLIDKVNGETRAKQFPKGHKMYGMPMDEAWLTNALGGGLPW